jgi:hypothetical protein
MILVSVILRSQDGGRAVGSGGARWSTSCPLLGDSLTFTSFNVRIPREKFVAALESRCEENATDAHNAYVAESKDRQRILGVSVIERLNREYGGNREALRSYVIGILSHAKIIGVRVT